MKTGSQLKRTQWKPKLGLKHPTTCSKLPQVKCKKRKVTSPLTKAKKALWALTRQEVFKLYGTDCFTCPKKNLVGVNCQGGHVPWPGSILSTECKYDVCFIRPQCYDCNINKGGMGAIALERMIAEGADIARMQRFNKKTMGMLYGLSWYQAKLASLQ